MKALLSIGMILFFVISVTAVQDSFASGKLLRTEIMKEGEKIEGRYNVILFGSRHADDVETIAILDREGDEYTIEPYAPDYDYKVMKDVSSSEALKRAVPFVSWHRSFLRVERSRIIDRKGRVIGYEIRPLYEPLSMGDIDVMYVDYQVKGDKVVVYIRLKRSVERILEGDGDGKPRFGK